MRGLLKLAADCAACRQGFHCNGCLCCLSEEQVRKLVEEVQMGGHGGRNNGLNWSEKDGEFTFNKYTVSSKEWANTTRPWLVSYDGEPLLRNHGRCTGYRRFGSSEAAKKWVEKRIAEKNESRRGH